MLAARRSTLLGIVVIGVVLPWATGCSDTNEPTTGAVAVSITTTGGDLDLDGYGVIVDDVQRQTIGVNAAVVIPDLPTGSHEVALSGVAGNCTVSGQTAHVVTVVGGDTTDVAYAIGCVATGVQVVIATTGADIDPDGYAVSVDGATPLTAPANVSLSITRLTAGSHTVTLSGIAGNCAASGTNPRSVVVAAGEVVPVGFPVTCLATTGSVAVSAVTSGIDLDANGYTVQVDNGAPRTLAVNATTVFEGLSAGDHSITLAGAAANCTVAGDNPRTVSVTTGGVTRDTARTTFQASCVAVTGVVEVTVVTSGVDLDQNGYQIRLDSATSQQVGGNGIVRFTGVSGGSHQVGLADAAPNCTVSGENPRSVSVTTGGATRDTARTTFDVTCVSKTGSLRVAAATSGDQLDPNGYTVLVDYVCDSYYGCYYLWQESIGVNGAVTITPIPTGEHTVLLTDVARNCTVTGANPRTVTVPPAATAEVTFTVTCAATGSMQVTAATTGVDPDPNGYDVRLDGAIMDTSAAVGANASVNISNLVAGDYSVTLGGVAANCDVVGPNPRTVSVPSGGTAAVGFDVTCAQATQLAVEMTVNGNTDVYRVQSNGTGLTQLTTHPIRDYDPAWSSGGTIAFVSERDGNAEIYVMNADGSNQVRLTNDPAVDHDPAWSPDGAQLAFQSRRSGDPEIWVMDANGSNLVRLTFSPDGDHDPVWSPDGSKIAFASYRDGDAEIYVMNADGSGVTRLTTNDTDDLWPDWSPDGTKLVFSHLTGCDYSGFCDYDLVVMNADGSGLTQLPSGSSDAGPVWSPDGRWIAFGASFCEYSYYYGCYYSYSAVYLVRTDGTRVVELLRDASYPAWRR